jgi:large subunit ribosomal protein LP2
MKHIAAYALLVVGGKEAPSADDVKAVITAAGGEADEEQLTKLFAELEGKSIHELLSAGETKLKSVVSAGGGGGGAAPAAGGAAAPAAAAAPEKPKEEEVDALDGGMDMFGGGGKGGGGDY